MSRNLVKTPAAVSAGGGSTSLWVLRLLSATSPTSPFSATSARTDSSCRPYKVEGAAAERQEGCGHRLPSPEARMMSPSTLEGSSGAASSVWRWDLKPWISAPTSSLASWFPIRPPHGSRTDPAPCLPGTFPQLPNALTVNTEHPRPWAGPAHSASLSRAQPHSVPSSARGSAGHSP